MIYIYIIIYIYIKKCFFAQAANLDETNRSFQAYQWRNQWMRRAPRHLGRHWFTASVNPFIPGLFCTPGRAMIILVASTANGGPDRQTRRSGKDSCKAPTNWENTSMHEPWSNTRPANRMQRQHKHLLRRVYRLFRESRLPVALHPLRHPVLHRAIWLRLPLVDASQRWSLPTSIAALLLPPSPNQHP